jgi:hypothetical protein
MVEGVVVVAPIRAPTWFEQRSCRCKVRLESRGEARDAAQAIVRRSGGTVMPYRCHFCDGWHVGHPIARR